MCSTQVPCIGVSSVSEVQTPEPAVFVSPNKSLRKSELWIAKDFPAIPFCAGVSEKCTFLVRNEKVHFSETPAQNGMAGKSLRIHNSLFLKDLLGETKTAGSGVWTYDTEETLMYETCVLHTGTLSPPWWKSLCKTKYPSEYYTGSVHCMKLVVGGSNPRTSSFCFP